MIFHENRLLADDSHEISYLIFFRKLGKMSQNLSSTAVVIGPLRIKATNQTHKTDKLLGFMRFLFIFSAAEIKGNVYVNVLKESILGKLLMQVDDYDTRQDVVTSYMSDYVHMVYHAHSDEEHAVSEELKKKFFSHSF